MKVLITGANGQLGSEFVEVFQGWEIVATDLDTLDITDKTKIKTVFQKEKPNWVIHAAAWTDVEGCAQNPEKAIKVNGEATKNIAEEVRAINAKMVYISTNEVFDGKKNTPYSETDKTNPINPYAVSKLIGEKYVQEILKEDGIIVRTSWVYGPKGKSNFPLKIIEAADKFGKLSVVDDEFAIPTYAPDLAKAVFKLLQKNPSGIYHLVNEGSCSRYDWAVQILENSGRKKIKIKRIKLKNYIRKSMPPAKSILINIRAKKEGIILRDWQKSLREYLDKFSD